MMRCGTHFLLCESYFVFVAAIPAFIVGLLKVGAFARYLFFLVRRHGTVGFSRRVAVELSNWISGCFLMS